jgi:hypothetical protein
MSTPGAPSSVGPSEILMIINVVLTALVAIVYTIERMCKQVRRSQCCGNEVDMRASDGALRPPPHSVQTPPDS